MRMRGFLNVRMMDVRIGKVDMPVCTGRRPALKWQMIGGGDLHYIDGRCLSLMDWRPFRAMVN